MKEEECDERAELSQTKSDRDGRGPRPLAPPSLACGSSRTTTRAATGSVTEDAEDSFAKWKSFPVSEDAEDDPAAVEDIEWPMEDQVIGFTDARRESFETYSPPMRPMYGEITQLTKPQCCRLWMTLLCMMLCNTMTYRIQLGFILLAAIVILSVVLGTYWKPQMSVFLGAWNEWDIQILVVLSFTLQVCLLLFGGIRRRSASFKFRILVWLAYMFADSTATYTLGHMASFSKKSNQHLVAFWAQFLLLHLGGQDTITAYALEDNELWLRHLLSLVVQAFGAAYLLYKYSAGGKLLIFPSIMVFVAGVLKYGERIWALKCASISNMQGPLVEEYFFVPSTAAVYLRGILLKRSTMKCGSLETYIDNAKAARYLTRLSQFLFVTPVIVSEWRSPQDYLNRGVEEHRFSYNGARSSRSGDYYLGRTYGGPWIPANHISSMIYLELSLMYELLYTKSRVIHTWYGYIIRVFSFFDIVSALVLFIITTSSGNRDSNGYRTADVAVTYVLLVGASVLETTSIFRVIESIWTSAYLDKKEWDRLARTVLSLRWYLHVRLRRWFPVWKHHTTSIGQYNLISMSIRLPKDIRGKIAELIWLEDRWNKEHYSTFIQASPAMVEVLCTEIQRRAELTSKEAKKLDDDIRLGRWTRHHDELERLSSGKVFGSGLMGFIFSCHIATDIFFHCCNQEEKIKTAVDLSEVAMALSNYMMYFLRVHKDMLPTSRRAATWNTYSYDTTCKELLPELFSSIEEYTEVKIKQEPGHTPQDILLNVEKHLSVLKKNIKSSQWKATILNRQRDSVCVLGSKIAARLLREEISLRQKFQILADLWVDTLLYVADGITANFHAKQLSYGSEFVTFVSLLVAHVGLQKQVFGPLFPKGDDACTGKGSSDNNQEIMKNRVDKDDNEIFEEPDIDIEMQSG